MKEIIVLIVLAVSTVDGQPPLELKKRFDDTSYYGGMSGHAGTPHYYNLNKCKSSMGQVIGALVALDYKVTMAGCFSKEVPE